MKMGSCEGAEERVAHLVQNHVEFELDAVSLLLADANLLMELLAEFLTRKKMRLLS